MRTLATYICFAALLTAGITAIGTAHAGGQADDKDTLAQVAELEQLHATFHAAASVTDNVNGDSADVITGRIREVLSIWAKDGELTIVNATDTAGNYIGNGDPDDPATCPTPSFVANGLQGTLCTFYKYVGASWQAENKYISLSPAYKTKFVPVRDQYGQWTSSVYFECHYFNVAANPALNILPPWTAVSHVDLDGQASKIGGKWLLTKATGEAIPVPLPPAP
jgi:hypothetical protein